MLAHDVAGCDVHGLGDGLGDGLGCDVHGLGDLGEEEDCDAG